MPTSRVAHSRKTTSFVARCAGPLAGDRGRQLLVASAILCLTPAARAQAQSVSRVTGMHHTSWLAGRELPAAGIAEVRRTPDGYLWLGSTVGLIRFDGVRFVVFDSVSAPALASDVPGSMAPLLVDRDGRLWISRPDGGLAWYRDGRFTVALDGRAGQPPISVMVQDGAGAIWARSGFRLLAWRDGQLVPPVLPPAAPDTGIINVLPDTGTGIWLGTRDNGLWHVTGGAARGFLPRVTPNALVQDGTGALWIGVGELQALERDVFRTVLAGSRCSCEATAAPDGGVWVSRSGDGLYRIRGARIERFDVADGLTSSSVRGMLADWEGNIWVVTERGLDRLRPAAFTTIGPREGLPFESPLHVQFEPDGSPWVVDLATLLPWELQGGIVRGMPGTITATVHPREGQVIVGAPDGGLWRFALHSDRVWLDHGRTVSMVDPVTVPWGGPRRGLLARDGTLWLHWSPSAFGRVRHFRFEPIPLRGDQPVRVAAIAEDARGHLWAAADSGRLFRVEGDSVATEFAIGTDLLRLVGQGGDTLWAASATSLVRLIGGAATVVRVPDLRGAFASLSTVLLHGGTHLWFGSETGIARLSYDALHAAADGRADPPAPQWFTELDGLRVARLARANIQAGVVAPDGRLWFSTPAGLGVVDPARLPANPVPPVPVVEEVVVDGRVLDAVDGVRVPALSDRLTIHFTAASLRMPERVRLEYQLEGVDHEWVVATAARTAEYSRLRPGRYTFQVRAWNEDGLASVSAATLGIQVVPAWHQRWSVRGLAVLLAAGSIALLAILAARSRHRAAQDLIRERYEAVLVERTRMARELHDTLLQGFTGITLQMHAIHQRLPHAPQEVAESLSRLMRVADASLREARDMVWDMRTPELDSQDLPSALEGLAQRACANTSIALTVRTEGERRRLPLELETTALRVVRECVANIIRHANASAVRITIAYGARALTVRVADNGAGFDPTAPGLGPEHGHWGLTGLRERARRVNGHLDIASGTGTGTSVTLTLPTA